MTDRIITSLSEVVEAYMQRDGVALARALYILSNQLYCSTRPYPVANARAAFQRLYQHGVYPTEEELSAIRADVYKGLGPEIDPTAHHLRCALADVAAARSLCSPHQLASLIWMVEAMNFHFGTYSSDWIPVNPIPRAYRMAMSLDWSDTAALESYFQQWDVLIARVAAMFNQRFRPWSP